MFINHFHTESEAEAKKGNIALAINLMLQAIQSTPNHPKLYEDLGVLYLHSKLKDEAIQSFDKALELEPDNPYRYSSRAFAKNYFKDHQGAIEDYEKAIEMDPEDAITRNNLGLALEQMGMYNKAEKHFNKSNEILGIEQKNHERIQPDSGKMKIEFEENSSEHKPKGVPLEPKPIEATSEEKESRGRIMMNVFSKKETFKEFVNFIKAGFKIKKND